MPVTELRGYKGLALAHVSSDQGSSSGEADHTTQNDLGVFTTPLTYVVYQSRRWSYGVPTLPSSAVVITIVRGCSRAPVPVSIASSRDRDLCTCSSSQIAPCKLAPCARSPFDDTTLITLDVLSCLIELCSDLMPACFNNGELSTSCFSGVKHAPCLVS